MCWLRALPGSDAAALRLANCPLCRAHTHTRTRMLFRSRCWLRWYGYHLTGIPVLTLARSLYNTMPQTTTSASLTWSTRASAATSSTASTPRTATALTGSLFRTRTIIHWYSNGAVSWYSWCRACPAGLLGARCSVYI